MFFEGRSETPPLHDPREVQLTHRAQPDRNLIVHGSLQHNYPSKQPGPRLDIRPILSLSSRSPILGSLTIQPIKSLYSMMAMAPAAPRVNWTG